MNKVVAKYCEDDSRTRPMKITAEIASPVSVLGVPSVVTRRLLRSNTGPVKGRRRTCATDRGARWCAFCLKLCGWFGRSPRRRNRLLRALSTSVIDHLSSPFRQGQGPIDETRSLDCRRSKFVGSRQRHTSGSLLLRSGQRTMLPLRCVCPVRQFLGGQTLLRNPL